jgi:hypothetical protein
MFRVNVFGGIGSPYIDLLVGSEWEVPTWLDEDRNGVISKKGFRVPKDIHPDDGE